MGKLKLNHFNLVDNFHLLAIHSSSEIFKIAFEINKKLKVSLKRIEDISYKNNKTSHSIYKYESLKYDSKMFLFSNKSMSDNNQISRGLLFQDFSQLNFILSEFPKTEYFLKIEQGEFNIPWLINILKKCSSILSCYKVEIQNEKSKYNLIFE